MLFDEANDLRINNSMMVDRYRGYKVIFDLIRTHFRSKLLKGRINDSPRVGQLARWSRAF